MTKHRSRFTTPSLSMALHQAIDDAILKGRNDNPFAPGTSEAYYYDASYTQARIAAAQVSEPDHRARPNNGRRHKRSGVEGYAHHKRKEAVDMT